jgi:hypothetical protein
MSAEANEKIEFDPQEMLNEFEAAYDEELAIAKLKNQIKVHTDFIKERLTDFASGYSIDMKILRKAWMRYKELKQEKFDPSDEIFYSAMAAVDEFFIEDEEEEDNN